MTSYYIYEGTISFSMNGCQSIMLGDINNWDKPPVAIEVNCKGLADYLENRSWDDAEERYITQGWIYDRNLILTAVVIPGDKAGWPAKVIACKDPEHVSDEIVIFGPEKLLNDPRPASMDREDFMKWLEHRMTFDLHPRNVRTAL